MSFILIYRRGSYEISRDYDRNFFSKTGQNGIFDKRKSVMRKRNGISWRLNRKRKRGGASGRIERISLRNDMSPWNRISSTGGDSWRSVKGGSKAFWAERAVPAGVTVSRSRGWIFPRGRWIMRVTCRTKFCPVRRAAGRFIAARHYLDSYEIGEWRTMLRSWVGLVNRRWKSES